MKKIRNIIIAALVCFLAAGLSIPVIASNLYGREEKAVKELPVSEADAAPQARAVSVVEKAVQETPAAQEPETEVKAQAVSKGSQICANYVDENGDGACDHCVGGSGQNQCANYVDANGDGICDHCVNGSVQNQCANYVDANGDGVCDHCVGGSAQNQGGGNGNGHHGGGHHAERRGHHGR